MIMLVTADEYELPLAVADSFWNMSVRTGIAYTTLKRLYKNGEVSHLRFNKEHYKVICVQDETECVYFDDNKGCMKPEGAKCIKEGE